MQVGEMSCLNKRASLEWTLCNLGIRVVYKKVCVGKRVRKRGFGSAYE